VKPRDSQAFHHRFGVKAFWPASRDDLLEKIGIAREEGLEVMIQEYVPGPASNHHFIDGFVDSRGVIRGIFVRRRLRMHPPLFGNSSYMVSIDSHEAKGAVTSIEQLLGQGDYRGVFSAEFKKDHRDGTFKILEVNARPWWFVEFAANCGMNFVGMAFRETLGLPNPEAGPYIVGKRFIHPYYDISACIRERGSGWAGVLDFLRAVPGADRPVLRWDDPLPAVWDFTDLAVRSLGRRIRGALKR
jgi:predicted ATP-grasp superfamily ATP-dependent carboligase